MRKAILILMVLVLASLVYAVEQDVIQPELLDTTNPNTDKYGCQICINENVSGTIKVKAVSRDQESGQTHAHLLNGDHTALLFNSSEMTGDTITPSVDWTVTKGTCYWLMMDANGSAVEQEYDATASTTPYSVQYLNVTMCSSPGSSWELYGNRNARLFGWENFTLEVTAAAPPGGVNVSTAWFQNVTPRDETRNNTIYGNISVECTYNGNATVFFKKGDGNFSTSDRVVTSNFNTSSWLINSSKVTGDDTYHYVGSCNINGVGNITNSSTWTWTYDTTEPSITLNPNNAFNTTNQTRFPYSNNLKINITIADNDDLFGFSINFTNNGVTYFNYTNVTLSGLSWTYNEDLIINDWPTDEFNVEIVASDSHTTNEIGTYKTKKITDGLEFQTEEWNTINIQSEDTSTMVAYKCQQDRYCIEVDFADGLEKKRTFFVSANNKIYYRENSGFLGHFVVTRDGFSGNWIDFEVENQAKPVATVTKINDYLWQIELDKVKGKTKFKSIGGLNVNTVNYKFNRSSISMDDVYITPQVATITSNLNAYCNASSGQAEGITFNYRMWLNESVLYNESTATGTNGTPQLLLNVGAGNLSENQNWTFSCRAKTAKSNYTNWVNSSALQIVSSLLDNCSVANYTSLNITFWDPNGTGRRAVNMEAFFEYGLTTDYTFNYTTSSASTDGFSMCIFPNTVSFLSDFLIEYNNLSYNAFQFNFSTTLQTLELYLQSSPTAVTFTVTDFSNDPVENAYIHILRWDIGSNSYRTTEILRTDVKGQAVGNIILNTVYYRFVITYDGITRLIDPETQGIKIYTTTRGFKISLDDVEWYEDYNTLIDATTSLIFNNNTNSFVYTWIDGSGAMENGCLKVTQSNQTGTTTLSDTCTASAAASIVYAITPHNGSRYIATGYFLFGDAVYIDKVLEQYFADARDIFTKAGATGSYMAFILILALVLVGLPFPELSFVLMSIGMIFSVAIKMWNVTWGLVVGIIILGLIYGFKGSRK